MDFELSEEQRLLQETVAAFARQTSPVSRARRLRADPVGWEAATWRQLGELGWLAIPFEPELGGLGAPFLDLALVMERLATALVPEPVLSSVVLAGTAVRLAGSPAQRAALLGPVIEGRGTLALAHAERGHRPADDRALTTATPVGGGWRLDGEKVFVLDGHRADALVVSAAAPGGLALLAVPGDAPGLERRRVPLIDGRAAAEVRLAGVIVPGDALLAAPGEAPRVLARAHDHGVAAAVAEGAGICQTVLELTVAYLQTREQFGVKLGTFQALQHHAVDMFVETELLRSMMLVAAVKVDEPDGPERTRLLSAAKVQLGMSAQKVVRTAIQLFGGIGVTDEHDVGLYFKRVQALAALFGDEPFHLARLASTWEA
jgi:alkylation response protein AidB-like acyl-CoA dehydrogenase